MWRKYPSGHRVVDTEAGEMLVTRHVRRSEDLVDHRQTEVLVDRFVIDRVVPVVPLRSRHHPADDAEAQPHICVLEEGEQREPDRDTGEDAARVTEEEQRHDRERLRAGGVEGMEAPGSASTMRNERTQMNGRAIVMATRSPRS